MDCSLPGSSIYEILQVRTLEWVVIPFSRSHVKKKKVIQKGQGAVERIRTSRFMFLVFHLLAYYF